MQKNKKTTLVVLIFLTFFGVLFFVSNIKTEEISPPVDSNPIGNSYGVIEINGARYESQITGETSVYDFMSKLQSEGKINFTEKNYLGMGKLIVAINGARGGGDRNWIYYVNGKEAQVGVSNYKIKSGDIVSWKLE
ncbi:MAG: DUF4430 domain-containing protein [Patescibacteria group bacterium]